MPRRALSPCTTPGCGRLATHRGKCQQHHVEAERAYQRSRPTARQRGYDSKWDEARKGYLAKHPFCVRCEKEGRRTAATVVDHIRPHHGDRALMWDSSNWQSLCKEHHDRKTASEDGWRGRRGAPAGPVRATIVCGPPGSGKTTYVREHALRGDLILDVDALYHALSGLPWYEKPNELLPFVMEARDAAIARLAKAHDVRHAWVIAGAARKADRDRLRAMLPGAAVVTLEVSPSECERRIREDQRRATRREHWSRLVREWWDQYEPDSGAPAGRRVA